MTTATELRRQAQTHEENAQASFERCDTDGFVSQWASGLNAQQCRMQADLLDNGGMATFPALFDLAGNRLAAKLIDGKYGTCWALCGHDGQFTGQFVNYIGQAPDPDLHDEKSYKRAVRGHGRQVANLRKKGFVEGAEDAPATVRMMGSNAVNVRPVIIRTDGGYPAGSKVI